MNKLYILCGVSGSGKSTWANNFIKDNPYTKYISRDLIRFRFLECIDNVDLRQNPTDFDYFSHENAVYNQFVTEINKSVKINEITIADATHINEKSRNKLVNKITEEVEIICVYFVTSLDECLKRNSFRTGVHKVPDEVIKRQFYTFTYPKLEENRRFNQIIEIRN